jgi:hypothetical protein
MKDPAPELPRRVERRVRASRALLAFEALVPALWPAGALWWMRFAACCERTGVSGIFGA